MYAKYLICLWSVPFFAVSLTMRAQAQSKACNADDICERGQICKRGYCVAGCRTQSDCSSGKRCVDTRCTSGQCRTGEQRECYDGSRSTKGVGKCRAGVQYCVMVNSVRQWSPCHEQILPTREVCDREDNDCDGRVDQGITCECAPGSQRQCYTGPSRTRSVGTCTGGIQSCGMDHRWGRCVGQQLPTHERCDGLDNDCDGQIDQGIRCDRPGAAPSARLSIRGGGALGGVRFGSLASGPATILVPGARVSDLKRVDDLAKILSKIRSDVEAARDQIKTLETSLRRR